MANRLYIVPSVDLVEAGNPNPARAPKYFTTGSTYPPVAVFRYAAMPYGFQPIFLVMADLLPADHAAMAAHADVTSFPENLDVTLQAGEIQPAKDALEAALIPAQSISATDTWRIVARMVAGMFQYMGRLYSFLPGQVLIDSSAKLNAQWSAIPQATQNAVVNAATSLGYSTSFIRNNTQIRAIIDNFSQQWGSKPFDMNGFII